MITITIFYRMKDGQENSLILKPNEYFDCSDEGESFEVDSAPKYSDPIGYLGIEESSIDFIGLKIFDSIKNKSNQIDFLYWKENRATISRDYQGEKLIYGELILDIAESDSKNRQVIKIGNIESNAKLIMNSLLCFNDGDYTCFDMLK